MLEKAKDCHTLMFQGVQQTAPRTQTGSFHGPHHYHPEETHYRSY